MKTKLLAAVLIAGILFILADKVYACGQPPMPPVADLTAYPALALVGEEVLLDGSESYDPDGFIILYQWDWEDDGEYDYSQPHTGDGKATHAYTDANLYTVRLRVVDNDLSDANTTCDVNVVRVKNITQGTGYNAIGPAIDDANDDDIIEVSKYTYESINFNGKKIHLRSTDPNDPCVVDGTVIDGSTSTDAVAFGQDGNSVLEGFTIRGGTRSRVYCYKSSPKISNCKIVNSTKNGTGIYCNDHSSPVITNCLVKSNYYGIYAYDSSSPSVTDCNITDNGSYGLWCYTECSPLITNCNITKNGSYGLYCVSSSPVITNCNITKNGSYGLYCSFSSPVITDCNITENYHGLGFSSGSPTVADCNITNNNWYGVYCYGSSAEISKCTVAKNGSYGLYLRGSSPLVYRCTIINNKQWAGARLANYCSGTLKNCVIAKNTGAGVSLNDAGSVDIINCTIVYNTNYGISGACNKVENSIVWGNNAGGLSNCEATYSCLQAEDSGLGNFSINPRFADVDANDFHLQNWSRCIDWGDPASDYSNEPEPNGDRINIGAYGNTPEANSLGDQNGDGLPEGWLDHYWPGYDPNDPNYGPGGNPDTDDFNNIVEYWFGYEPNQATVASMKLIVGLSTAKFDPTQSEKLTVIYLINMHANVVVTSTNPDTNETVWNFAKTVAAGRHDPNWDGTEPGGLIVEDRFWDIALDANDNDGNTADYGPVPAELYYVHDINSLMCNPYRILPLYNEVSKITYDLTTDANMIVTVYDPCGVLFATLLDDVLQTAASNPQELEWCGRNKDPGEPDSGYISKDGAYLVRVRFVGMREKEEATVTAYR